MSKTIVKPGGVVLSVAAMLLFSGCSSQAPVLSEDASDAALAFVHSYDEWAQSGYAAPIPTNLTGAVSNEMLQVLESDQRWYLGGGVRQHGSVRILESEVLELSDQAASVKVTLDASEVTVTAEGQQTFVDYTEPIETTLNLDRESRWIVRSTSSSG